MTATAILERIRHCDPVGREGRVVRVLPNLIEGDGPNLPLGGLCRVGTSSGLIAEIIGINRGTVHLAPYQPALNIPLGERITALPQHSVVAVGDGFLGRAIDGLGMPIDGEGPIRGGGYASITMSSQGPLARITPREQIETGVRAIDGLLPLAKGQRVGIFAASGVGKTSLLNQLSRQIKADRCVVCCIGERGREIEHLWSRVMPDAVRERSVMVAATSDESAVMRVRAAQYALALARHWRAQGHHVLLMFDSISRYAMALREVGLAAGEPPTVRAYTPNVFAALPQLVEQCGALREGGAITAFFSVLSETDDNDDPIAEVMKSLLDGHIILGRELAARGQFPAIDIARSISRLAEHVSDHARINAMAQARDHMATFSEARLLIESGLYTPGVSPRIDRAVAVCAQLDSWLRQASSEAVMLKDAHRSLTQILEG